MAHAKGDLMHQPARYLLALASLACLVGFAPVAEAQSGAAPGWPKVFEVTPDKLNLRAGIGQNYRVLIAVKRGDLVVGEEEQVGWIRVRSPKGIRCYVSRDFIDKSASGADKVNADHVNLRPTAGTTHPPLLQLNRGDSVKVLGETEGWYEIEAPAAVSCWATKEHLREVGPWTGRERTVDVTGGGEPAGAVERTPEPGAGEHPTKRTDENPGGTGEPAGTTGGDHPTKRTDEHPGGTGEPAGTTGGDLPTKRTDEHPGGTGEPAGTTGGEHPTKRTDEHPGGTGEPAGTTGGEHPTGRTDEHPSGTGEPAGTTGGDHPTGRTDEPAGTGMGETEGPAAGTGEPGSGGEPEAAPADEYPGRASFEEGMRRMRIEDEKEVRDQDFGVAIRQFEIALAAGLPADLQARADVELRRLRGNQKILDELRTQDREIRAISEAERRRQREEARDRRNEPWLAEGWVDGVGKLINRPSAHKLVKGKKTLYFLNSIKINFNDYHGKRVGVRGKIVDAPGWDYKVIIVEEIAVLGE